MLCSPYAISAYSYFLYSAGKALCVSAVQKRSNRFDVCEVLLVASAGQHVAGANLFQRISHQRRRGEQHPKVIDLVMRCVDNLGCVSSVNACRVVVATGRRFFLGAHDAACAFNQAVTAPARQRVHLAPLFMGAGKVPARTML